MFSVIKEIFNLIPSIILYGWLFTGGITGIYQFLKKEVVMQVARGIPPLTKFTRKMTCVEYDKNLKEIPITTGACKKQRK